MHQFHRPIRGPEPSGSNLRQAQVHPSRMPGPDHCLRRGASAPDSALLRELLQQSSDAPVTQQRRAGASSDSAPWRPKVTSCPRWTASPIRPNLVFGTDRPAGSSSRFPVGADDVRPHPVITWSSSPRSARHACPGSGRRPARWRLAGANRRLSPACLRHRACRP